MIERKRLHFVPININSLIPKIDELKCFTNKTKPTIIGRSESKFDLILKLTFQGMIFSDVIEIEREVVLLVI